MRHSPKFWNHHRIRGGNSVGGLLTVRRAPPLVCGGGGGEERRGCFPWTRRITSRPRTGSERAGTSLKVWRVGGREEEIECVLLFYIDVWPIFAGRGVPGSLDCVPTGVFEKGPLSQATKSSIRIPSGGLKESRSSVQLPVLIRNPRSLPPKSSPGPGG